MDKAYNIFILLIIFGLILYFLPQITKLFDYKEGAGNFNLSSILGSNKALVSFDEGESFKNARLVNIKRFFSDGNNRLFTAINNKVYISFDNGKSWRLLDEVNGLNPRQVLETERNGRIVLVSY